MTIELTLTEEKVSLKEVIEQVPLEITAEQLELTEKVTALRLTTEIETIDIEELSKSNPLYAFQLVNTSEYLGDFVASHSIISGKLVTVNGDGELEYADANNIQHADKTIGIALSSVNQGEITSFIIPQTITGSFGFIPGSSVYLANDGDFTNNNNYGLFQQELGIALSSTKILFKPGLCIIR